MTVPDTKKMVRSNRFEPQNRWFCNKRSGRLLLKSGISTVAILAATGAALSMSAAALAASPDTTVSTTVNTPPNTTNTKSEIPEITVSARRVSESQQKVPVSLTTFTPKALAVQDIRSLSTLTQAVGGVEMFGGAYAPLVYVRGILNGSPGYFADAPLNQLNGYETYFDVSNITVLKGPQGTLFGQASNGGAFLFEPTKPGNKFGGTVTLSGGDFERREGSAAVDFPLADGRILTRFAGDSFYQRGYIHDLSNGLYYGDQNYYILRPSMTVKITDDIENYTTYQFSHFQDSGNPYAEVPYDYNFNPSQLPILNTEALENGGSLAAFNALRAQLLKTQEQIGPYQTLGLSVGCASPSGPQFTPRPITSLNYKTVACPGDWTDDNIFVNHTKWTFLQNFTLTNIFSHTWGAFFQQPIDNDASLLIINDGGSPRNIAPDTTPPTGSSTPANSVWSDEVQVHGTVGRFDFQVGTFNTYHRQAPVLIYSLSETGTQAASATKYSGRSDAVYGQTNVHLDELLKGLTLTVGARYNVDEIGQTSWNYNPTTLALIGVSGTPSSPSGLAHFHNVSYTGSLQYQYTPGTMFYVTNSRGYSAGGLQNVVGFPSYQPAVLTNLEGGVKTTFHAAGIPIRLNVDVYNGWFDNAQVQTYALITNSVTGIQAPGQVTQNAATAIIRGTDVDYVARLTPDFTLNGFLSYIDAKYTKWPSLNPTTLQPIDLASTPFRDTPKIKLGVGASYNVDLGAIGNLVFNANYSHRSHISEVTAPETPTNPANPRSGLICTRKRTVANGYPVLIADGAVVWVDCSPPMQNLDLGVDWIDFMGHDNMTLNLTVTNVTGNIVQDTRSNGDLSNGATAIAPAPPRMYYMKVTYKF